MAKSLLEQARATPIHSTERNKFNSSQLEALAVAWMKGEITTSQAQMALGRVGSTLYGLLANAVRRGVEAGRIKLQ